MERYIKIAGGKMIYFDNAATTYPKPPEVIKTMSRAMVHFIKEYFGIHRPNDFPKKAYERDRKSVV